MFCHLGILLALGFNIWISFRVLDDWMGLWGAVVGILVFPITAIVLPVVMFFIPSEAAGPLALWPGVVVVGTLFGILNKMPDVDEIRSINGGGHG